MMTQKIFDIISVHLITQNERSLDEAGMCLYQNPRGLKCAVGALIPDAEYNVNMEGEYFSALSFSNKFSDSDGQLISLLQKVHDHSPPSEWRTSLHILAKLYCLSTSGMDGV